MKNWTDPIINWNQLPGTEVRRLLATWGMTPEQIARYDKKHGFATADAVTVKRAVAEKPVKTAEPAAKKTVKTVAKKPAVKRQRHTGTDGEIKFVEHRNLYVGFCGGRVVVTKRTAEACRQILREQFKLEV
jgi:hypothetical protein